MNNLRHNISMASAGLIALLIIPACSQNQGTAKERVELPPVDPVASVAVQPPFESRQYIQPIRTDSSRQHEQIQSANTVQRSALMDINGYQSMAPKVVESNRERYARMVPNGVTRVLDQPLSTFSIDVDTAAYSVVRRHLNQGVLPPRDAVRIEELINYFDYRFEQPKNALAPFAVSSEMMTTPWNPNTRLLQIGLQGYLPENESRSAANLVFLVDVSGSMNAPNKLPLLKNAFRLLVKQLDSADRISLVVYAGSSGVALESTAGDQRATILAALEQLSAGGSTHGSSGIQLAYRIAQQSYIEGGINRVILATDGDFNVGVVDHDALLDLVEKNKSKGISLTTLGFGEGNYNDHLMEQLADHGDGNYAYVDNLSEARKVLVQEVSATLQTIAQDVKIQIEWNPAQVAEYRLIGYENRLLQREDFNNDRVDAGDIGAGHSVTALYEITLADSEHRSIDTPRYQQESAKPPQDTDELAFIKLRYKKPGEQSSRLIERVLSRDELKPTIDSASHSLRFAASVAAFGELLRGAKNLPQFGYQDVLRLARSSRGEDLHGYRGEFLRLVELAETLDSAS